MPINPASRSVLLASQFYTAVSLVNVTDYGEYALVDSEAVAAFRAIEKRLPIGFIETTYGLIRLSSTQPTFFISTITDREGNFDTEVTPGQNYVAAFNGGIVIGQFIADLTNS